MVRRLEAGECSITCSDGGGCIAVSDQPEICKCYCEPTAEIAVFETPLETETRIDVDVADLDLVSFGALLDANFDGDVMVPAAEAYSPVSIQSEGARFSDVCKEVGLEYRIG